MTRAGEKLYANRWITDLGGQRPRSARTGWRWLVLAVFLLILL